MLAWGIWGRRKKFIYEKATLSPHFGFDRALAFVTVFQDCYKAHRPKLLIMGCWQPPYPGVLKLNIDGALFKDMQAVGCGVISRDQKGEALLAASIKEPTF